MSTTYAFMINNKANKFIKEINFTLMGFMKIITIKDKTALTFKIIPFYIRMVNICFSIIFF